VPWAFTSSAVGFGYVDEINLKGAAGNGIFVERKVSLARLSLEEPTTPTSCRGYPLVVQYHNHEIFAARGTCHM
jgi:hypothetical protein